MFWVTVNFSLAKCACAMPIKVRDEGARIMYGATVNSCLAIRVHYYTF